MIAAAYTAEIYDMIGRAITHDSMSRIRLRQFEQHNKLIEEHEDPEKLPEISKTFGIVKAMDLVPTHLRERLGVKKVALSYIIRDKVIPDPLPPQATNSPISAEYNSIMEELIDYAPHNGDAYTEDNTKDFQILQDMVAGSSFETSIKSFQRTRDGRKAYLALVQHNLGSGTK